MIMTSDVYKHLVKHEWLVDIDQSQTTNIDANTTNLRVATTCQLYPLTKSRNMAADSYIRKS